MRYQGGCSVGSKMIREKLVVVYQASTASDIAPSILRPLSCKLDAVLLS
jgi:hypothetical protein